MSSVTTTPVKVYTTNHQHSRVICTAFAEGCGGQIVPAHRLLDGPAAMYGILRGTGEIIKECEFVGRDFYYIDHGYLSPGHYDGFYRVTKNGMQAEGMIEKPPDRWEALNLELRPWRRKGRHILVCPLTGAVGSFLGIDPQKWIESVTREISQHTARPIQVKQKGEGELKDSLLDCWCLVTHSSNAAVDALRDGVPVITLGDSAAWDVAWAFENIEKPIWPDREPWLFWLAYQQFSLSEMRDGTAWKILTDDL